MFTDQGWDDYLWFQSIDKKLAKKLNSLIKDCQRTPFSGLGKPEPLVQDLSGWWSRRLDQKNRLVYRVVDEHLEIAKCRGQY